MKKTPLKWTKEASSATEGSPVKLVFGIRKSTALLSSNWIALVAYAPTSVVYTSCRAQNADKCLLPWRRYANKLTIILTFSETKNRFSFIRTKHRPDVGETICRGHAHSATAGGHGHFQRWIRLPACGFLLVFYSKHRPKCTVLGEEFTFEVRTGNNGAMLCKGDF